MPRIMVLPSRHPEQLRVVSIPEDIEAHDAYRHATGIIAAVQEENSDCTWEDLQEALEAHNFRVLEHVLGPELVCPG